MRDDVQRDLNQSSADFVRVVWPVVQAYCGELQGSDLRMVEGHGSQPIAQDLDMHAGIDAYQRTSVGLRGIASRVQWWTNYQTFTVRISRPNGVLTEYIKRLMTITRRQEGFLYPYWTIQAYLDEPGGQLLSVGVAKSIELYPYIERREQSASPCKRLPARRGGEQFLVVEWEKYLAAGNYLFVYPGLTLEGSCYGRLGPGPDPAIPPIR